MLKARCTSLMSTLSLSTASDHTKLDVSMNTCISPKTTEQGGVFQLLSPPQVHANYMYALRSVQKITESKLSYQLR